MLSDRERLAGLRADRDRAERAAVEAWQSEPVAAGPVDRAVVLAKARARARFDRAQRARGAASGPTPETPAAATP